MIAGNELADSYAKEARLNKVVKDHLMPELLPSNSYTFLRRNDDRFLLLRV